MPSELERHRIPGAPASMYYLSDFISADEEANILNKIPPNRWISLSHRRLQAIPSRLTANNTLASPTGLPAWLTQPVAQRLRDLGVFAASPHAEPNHCLVNEYLPGQGILAHEDGAAYFPVVATVSLGGSVVLDVREKDGLQSNGDHDHDYHDRNDNDGDNDSITPATASEPSSGGARTWRILQEPRSLLVTAGDAYTRTLHGIAEVSEDVELGPTTVANWELLRDAAAVAAAGGRCVRATRISLTFRDVLRVSSVAGKIFGRPRT